jgi:hypothetical protein
MQLLKESLLSMVTNIPFQIIQKKLKDISGVAEVYTLPTFPHGSSMRNQKGSEQNTSQNRDEKGIKGLKPHS